jgi:protein-S-isoprenylcysteine O-methyltransferase Ste14
MKRMTVWGIGRKLTASTAAFAVVVAAVNYYFLPQWRFTVLSEKAALVLGVVLIMTGVVALVTLARTVTRAFKAGELATTGMFSITRNPMYCAWIIFIVPGIVIICRDMLLWLIPAFMYGAFKVLIKQEEVFLEQKFGDEYRAYRARVNELFPGIPGK